MDRNTLIISIIIGVVLAGGFLVFFNGGIPQNIDVVTEDNATTTEDMIDETEEIAEKNEDEVATPAVKKDEPKSLPKPKPKVTEVPAPTTTPLQEQESTVPPEGEAVACTQEAKMCPDGSYVGRVGPNCEFEACPAIPDPTPTPALGDLVGHWTFDEGSGDQVNDISGYGNHGTVLNADPTPLWVLGQIGGALKFDGLNDYISIPHSNVLNIGDVGESYSISFWFKRDGKPSSERQIIGKGGRSGASPFMLRISQSGYPSFRISDGFQTPTMLTKQSIAGTNTWHHITAIRDTAADVIHLYIDGTENGLPVPDTTTQTLQNSLDVIINQYDAGSNGIFYDPFTIDDVRIYNRALQTVEVKELYNTGKTGG